MTEKRKSVSWDAEERLNEVQGVIKDAFELISKKDGYKTALVVMEDGSEMTIPHRENYPGYPVAIRPGLPLSVRRYGNGKGARYMFAQDANALSTFPAELDGIGF